MPSLFDLRLAFSARQKRGSVSVDIRRNTDPASVGCSSSAFGFPICAATVEFDGQGYDSLLGWVQLVSAGPTSAPGPYALDPLAVYDGLDTPFGFFGIAPTLFNAPSRRDRTMSLDWRAESYLCVAPHGPMKREVQPVAAFSWGFVLDDGEIEVREPAALPPEAWTKHLPLLGRHHPTWTFLSA